MEGALIGKNCSLGQNVMIGSGVMIGDRVKVQNNVSVYSGVQLESDVFCGPSCVFTNVINPRAELNKKSQYKPTHVKQGATIGANATIVCGVTIGRYSLIGAGAVIINDVLDFALVVGNPGTQRGWVCYCGETLNTSLKCESCSSEFKIDETQGNLVPIVEKKIEGNEADE